jgi:very-short-patch-repair endonuclease
MLKTDEKIVWNLKLNKFDISHFYNNKNKKYWFTCNDCNHDFLICFLKYKVGRRCPYCSNPPKKLCNNESCIKCYNKSFLSHPKSKYWNIENNIIPRYVFNGTRKKYLFTCDKCNHIFKISIDAITILNQWCQFCANQKLCENTNCIYCFNKSFASHPKSKYFNNTNNLKPREIFKSTHKKYEFTCNICYNVFNIALNKITCEDNWCSKCKYKTELKLLNHLKSNHGDIIHQAKFDWCKNKRCLPFDFLIKSKNIIIELDGLQHFKQVSNWKSPTEIQKIDNFKMKCALENNYRIIRLLQNDILKNKFDWKTELEDSINSDKQCIFICKNEEYKVFKNN